MMLIAVVLIPMIAGLLAWAAGKHSPNAPRWISLAAMVIDLTILLTMWNGRVAFEALAGGGPWLMEVNLPWMPGLGIGFHLAMDGISLLMLILSAFLGILSVGCSWTEIKEKVGFFHFNLMWVLSGIMGVFLAMDLFLFYCFWELMLVPMYFLIVIWGHENRIYAAIKFFIFTQFSGLLMLLAILALYFIHGHATGVYSFDYAVLLGTPLTSTAAKWIMLGFFIAFAVKLPAVPVHNWLPDAHTEAPTAGSVILAGLLLKTGAYGLIRFVVPLFPQAAMDFAPVAMFLAVLGIIYGAVLSFAQTDLKRLVAYSSISHMGFVLLGIFAWNTLGLQGAVMQMICHGLGTGALFMLVGAIQERIHTRNIEIMGGFWTAAPRMGAVAMFFAMASLGLPGLGNFIGEFLVLLGSYRASVMWTAIASLGLVLGSIYSLWIIQKAFFGPKDNEAHVSDLAKRELAMFAALMVALVWLGMYPAPVLRTADPAVTTVQQVVEKQLQGGTKVTMGNFTDLGQEEIASSKTPRNDNIYSFPSFTWVRTCTQSFTLKGDKFSTSASEPDPVLRLGRSLALPGGGDKS
ncbi:MAG TPA: NADH-quinone oxidoreductase subunit M [Candidatus Hydrogenedentes bacterium]|nr:NADH-quinone oxidoreductase subunit M [Candidatus Hydrogenedentota bacterium]